MPRKSRHNLFDLPPLELQCMKELWALGEATVEEIRARLMPARPLAYTTVLTVMDRLARKGVAQRHKRGRAHVYSSAVAEEAVREHALGHLVDNFFDGSRQRLRDHLAGAPASEFKMPLPEPRPAPPPAERPKPRPARKKVEPAPQAGSIDPSLL